MLRLLSKPNPLTLETPEQELVRRAQEGESGAFAALFERHVGSVRRFLRDLLSSDDAAEETTQETFVRAHLLLGRLDHTHRVKGFLLGIARNVAFEHRRLGPTLEWTEASEEAPIEAVIPSPSPESLMLDRETEVVFSQALAALPAPRRAALLMRLDHGLTYDEIATAMGWSLPTVKNEIHRARLKLRQLLLPHLLGEPR